MGCYCGHDERYENCCLPFIEESSTPETPEKLMRSRYSAYCIGNLQYILNTYAEAQRKHLTLNSIKESSTGTHWTALLVCSSDYKEQTGQVEFKAFYRLASGFYVLHETSDFIKEDNQWRYATGVIQNDSGKVNVQRNSPCPCLSKLKYKRCCGNN